MALIKKTLVWGMIAAVAAGGYFAYWAQTPITTEEPPIDFTIAAGSNAGSASQQIADAGIPVPPLLFNLLARFTGKSAKLKAGSYELKPGTTPLRLIQQLVRGEFAQESLTIIEGWTFKQMRLAMAAHKGLKHDTVAMSDKEVMRAIGSEYKLPEG